MANFLVYIIYSESLDVYYKGYTNNLEIRLEEHLSGKSQFTSQTKDWCLVFTRSFELKSDALKYEKMLKRQNHQYLKWLIDGDLNELNIQ
ncbi:GIY-YIG nuclease family protein [Moheibacter sp. BDHS18]|uniref:GIY-YIG nuclease family protein n=2 Tax=Moheibacter lacus TaxID=2745851 RepID=A0A838ZPW1_9FLAO|nr:GIY-YIG nuclease family protein [Moheibacter lacus]